MPTLSSVCANCGKSWLRHKGDLCPDGKGKWRDIESEQDMRFQSTDIDGHRKPLDWDPKRTTPYDPFKDWTDDPNYDGVWSVDNDYENPNFAEAQRGEVHPLQKG